MPVFVCDEAKIYYNIKFLDDYFPPEVSFIEVLLGYPGLIENEIIALKKLQKYLSFSEDLFIHTNDMIAERHKLLIERKVENRLKKLNTLYD